MATIRTSYTLEIHIDSQRITKKSLEEKANQILQKSVEKDLISLQINTPHDFYHQLVINGDIKPVDAFHYEIQEEIIKKEDLEKNFYRYIDEVGDEIRYRIYPILAEIEQRFRAFISKALAEIQHFGKELNPVLDKINKRASSRYKNSRNNQIAPHYLEYYLECTDFKDLIEFINFKQPLQDCHSFDDLKLKWTQNKKELSFWEIIFSKYFENPEQWDNHLKKELEGFVIEVRNKVMHHRPIRFCEIERLDKIKQELINVFDSAKPKLSEEERIEAQQEIHEIVCHWSLTGKAKEALIWLTEQETKFQKF